MSWRCARARAALALLAALAATRAAAALGEPLPADERTRAALGQMLMVGARGTRLRRGGELERLICGLKPAGVVLYRLDAASGRPRNIVSSGQLRALTRELQAKARECGAPPLLIAADMEGGSVSRLDPKDGFPAFPGHGRLGAGRPRDTYRSAARMGRLLREHGVNFNLAPVVDVALDEGRAAAGDPGRSFSSDPETVAAHAAAFVRGLRAHRVSTALKHFPGYAAARLDPHEHLVDVTGAGPRDGLLPYRRLIAAGLADAVMTSHSLDRALDPAFPATFSSATIGGLLRGRLSFPGLVVSDDLQMQGLARLWPLEEASVLAARAGVELLIVSNNGPIYDPDAGFKARAALERALADGRLPRERVERAAESVRRFKGLNE